MSWTASSCSIWQALLSGQRNQTPPLNAQVSAEEPTIYQREVRLIVRSILHGTMSREKTVPHRFNAELSWGGFCQTVEPEDLQRRKTYLPLARPLSQTISRVNEPRAGPRTRPNEMQTFLHQNGLMPPQHPGLKDQSLRSLVKKVVAFSLLIPLKERHLRNR